MNKKNVLILTLILTISSAASTINMVEAKENNVIPIYQVAPTPTQGITTNLLKSYILNEKEVQTIFGNFLDDIEKLKFQTGYYVFDNDKYGIKDSNVYVMISLGQRNTTGYGIKVASVEDIEGVSRIAIQETKPQPGTMQGQIVTYPYVIVKFAQGTSNVKVTTDTGKELYSLKDSSELEEKSWNDLKPWWNVSEDKEWLITFKNDISKAEISSDTIYVRDSSGIKLPVELTIGEDKKTLKVTPIGKYIKGQTYYLFISNNINTQKHSLNESKGYRMMFTVQGDVTVGEAVK